MQITLHLRWPLLLLAFCVVAQLLMPDPVWSTAAILLAMLYVGAYFWLRAGAHGLDLERTRAGSLLVVGDTLEEEWRLDNRSSAALLWVEVLDHSTLPGYFPGRVVGAGSNQRWRSEALCTQRGRFRLGPQQLLSADPLTLFSLTVDLPASEELLIIPRVVRLPALPLPRGEMGGETRARRPLFGLQPAPSVRSYQPSDDLRYVHWPATAHHAALMVRELELEPAGDLWILLDSSAAAILPVVDSAPPPRAGEQPALPALPPNTFEAAVSAAAGIGAALLETTAVRGVGLLAASGNPPTLVTIAPRRLRGQLWTLLAALAPLESATLDLAELLSQARILLPSRSSLIVVTGDLADATRSEAWAARLVSLRERGLFASALLITTPESASAAAGVQALLARHRIEALLLPANARLPAALTQRRRRTVVRSSPLGRAVAVEVEEEVG